MDNLDFWRDKYKIAPPDFKPIIATFGKLLKLGENATAQDIPPTEMLFFCNAVGWKINFPQAASNKKWNIPPAALSVTSDRIKHALTENDSHAEPLNFDFDYDAEKAMWLDFLRDLFKRVKDTDNSDAVATFGKNFSQGATLDSPELHNTFIDIAENVIAEHDDLYKRFLEKFLFAVPLDVVKDFPDVDFWQEFENFTGGSLFHAVQPYTLYYFRPDALRFFQIYSEEVGLIG